MNNLPPSSTQNPSAPLPVIRFRLSCRGRSDKLKPWTLGTDLDAGRESDGFGDGGNLPNYD